MKILVVEDDELNADALSTVLTDQNYAVEVATDGNEAWDLVETYDYDLIILDVILPKLDGISLCRQIRSSGRQVPILLLTGCDRSHEKAIGLDAGADDYVVKPFDQEELIARVRALLRRGSITSSPVLAWGNLQLDPSSCEVTYTHHLISLTPKEYALLELFLRNTRRVFSCGMILEHLWSYEDTPGEEAVRTHIKGLRMKLRLVGAPSDFIETVYGIGYRLKPQQEESKTTNSPSQQQTLTAITHIWQKFRGRVDEQMNILEQAAQTLTPELLSQATQDAHTLAGSLGTFGLPLGSDLAKKIETLLKSGQTFTKTDITNLQNWVQLLRQQIESKNEINVTPPSTEEIEDQLPSQQRLTAVKPVFNNSLHAVPKILVVDDDPQILALLQTLLTPWGLNIIPLHDPRQFSPTLATEKPDLLILDVEMPYIKGIELCQLVRNNPQSADLPILFLTVHNDTKTINQLFSAGADDFVSKPIIESELVTRIINRLERVKLTRLIAQTHNTQITDKIHDEIELKVTERTAELITINQQLQSELNERKRIQEALEISETRFEGILSIADDAIISIDGNQCITLFNQGAEKIFGYSAQEVLGKRLDLLLPMRFAEQHRHHVTDFGKSPNPARRMGERRELFGRHKDGNEFPAEASISKLDIGSECVYTVILRDITERKKIERMKDEFVSVVSHELRTPLTSIHGSLGMLASGLLPTNSEQGKRLLQIATDSTDRLMRLINDILDIERIESGKVKMERENCNLDEIISSALNIMQPLANKAGVSLSISSLSVQLWADPDRIIQTLTNLLSNAIKFSTSGSTVWLTVQQQKDEVILTVKDTGRGIPSDKLDSIFERFQQVDSSDSRNHEGTGLGLAISKSIVQQHGGQIWVESVFNEGSTFYLTLPIRQFPQPELENSAPEEMLMKGIVKMTNKRILIVDNEQYIQEVAKICLETVAGWEVFTASSGKEGIVKAENYQPDAILLDVMMPDMDGLAAFENLQANPATKAIPVILLTAKIQIADRRRYAQLGIKSAIAKPFNPLELAGQVSAALGWTLEN
ncbi:response regulator [Anabaena cylindrica UHCC 0172]|uniref:response regulator n=1 Tax=Anabaena cylindrica TaxID=1165 RepID=UPI002B1F42EB|nr:response regulator [Anabaena cylindrica]MEA5550369.1 response regulator [Anabaena cylindrica UHCC 0172]